MKNMFHTITRFDSDLEPKVFDANDPEARHLLQKEAAHCPICAALLDGHDPLMDQAVNRHERRLRAKLQRKGKGIKKAG